MVFNIALTSKLTKHLQRRHPVVYDLMMGQKVEVKAAELRRGSIINNEEESSTVISTVESGEVIVGRSMKCINTRKK